MVCVLPEEYRLGLWTGPRRAEWVSADSGGGADDDINLMECTFITVIRAGPIENPDEARLVLVPGVGVTR